MERNKHEMNEISFYDYMEECEVNGYHEELTIIHTYRILLIMKCMVC